MSLIIGRASGKTNDAAVVNAATASFDFDVPI